MSPDVSGTATTRSHMRRGWRELTLVVTGFGILTVMMTAPLAFHLGTVGRVDNADTRLLIWNVAWVARTLVVDPFHLFDANIFYPHTGTLAYSEPNLGAGILAIPMYWATRNPYAAHNFVVLLSFVLSTTATYYLVRYLVGDWRAAAVAAICFGYCPYIFARLPHVHLLMTAGLPLSMLAFHRVADQPTWTRGAALGMAMVAQALFCGYYAVFVALAIGIAVLVTAATRRRWTDARYWTAVIVAAAIAIALAFPLFLPFMRLQHAAGFSRSLDEARQWSADWRAYLASSAHAHTWLLPMIGHWKDVLFPGFVAIAFGTAGVVVGWRAGGRLRDISILYGALAALTFWVSFGPDAGLYGWLYGTLPAFTLLRAASRFGVLVVFALSVLTGVSISALLARPGARGWPGTVAAVIVAAVTVGELRVPLTFPHVPPSETAYRVLATLPRGPVLELPFYSSRFAFERTQYMLSSTVHWMPLVNGYSSYIPQDVVDRAETLGGFPTSEAFDLLERDRVRYVVFHMNLFAPPVRDDLVARLRRFEPYLRRRYADDRVWLYEIIEFPGQRHVAPAR